jgi:hypothetical protein
MPKKILFISLGLILILFANEALAQKDDRDNAVERRSTTSIEAREEAEQKVKSIDAAIKNKIDLEEENDTETTENAGPSERALMRRSAIANAVQEFLNMASSSRAGGIGQELKQVIQNAKEDQDTAENNLAEARNRSSFWKFIVGANDKKLDAARKKLTRQEERLLKLQELETKAEPQDKPNFNQQIMKLQNIINEVKTAIEQENNVFSLFGWLKRLF